MATPTRAPFDVPPALSFLYVVRFAPPARPSRLAYTFLFVRVAVRLRLLVPPWWLYVPFAFAAAHLVWRRDIRLQHSAECSAIRLCALALGCTLARLALYVCLPVPRLQRSHSALLARLCAPRWAHPHVYSLFHARPCVTRLLCSCSRSLVARVYCLMGSFLVLVSSSRLPCCALWCAICLHSFLGAALCAAGLSCGCKRT